MAADKVNGLASEPAQSPSLLRGVSQESASNADLHRDGDATPEVLDHAYRPLLDRLGSECQHVLSIAQSEAESLRAAAAEESRRIVADAHRERAMVLSRATAKQALMYKEAEAEIGRWLQQVESERAAVLSRAREEADRMVRAISDETRVRANAYLEAAKEDAQRIVGAARIHTEIERQAVIADAPAAVLPVPPGPPSPPGPVSPSAGASSPEAADGERRPGPIRTEICSLRRLGTRVPPAGGPSRRRPTTCCKPSPRPPPHNLFAIADATDSAGGTPTNPDLVSAPVASASSGRARN